MHDRYTARIWTAAEGAMMDPVTEQKEWIKARLGARVRWWKVTKLKCMKRNIDGEYRGEINDIQPFTNFHAQRVSRLRKNFQNSMI